MTLPENCKACDNHKFRVVSMVLVAKDAGNQCHHSKFEHFKKIEDPKNIPDWCPLRSGK